MKKYFVSCFLHPDQHTDFSLYMKNLNKLCELAELGRAVIDHKWYTCAKCKKPQSGSPPRTIFYQQPNDECFPVPICEKCKDLFSEGEIFDSWKKIYKRMKQ